jgi:hypothetical protein
MTSTSLDAIARLLDERLAPVLEQLNRIEAALAIRRDQPGEPAPADLEAQLLDVIDRLNAARQYGGLVPIPAVRRELHRRGVSATRKNVDAMLHMMEVDGLVQLLVAQSPATLPDRSDGIDVDGRGLIYYVARSRPGPA